MWTERVWKPDSFHGFPWIAQFGYGIGGVSRQVATDAVVCTASKCHDSWYWRQWNALHSRSSEVSVLISGRLRRLG